MEMKQMFGRQYIAVKNTVLLVYFEYDNNGKVFYNMKVVGKLVDRKKPISPENVEVFDKHDQFYLYADEPLMTVDGKQRVLPRAVLTCALDKDTKRMQAALVKLSGVLRHSIPFRKVYGEVL